MKCPQDATLKRRRASHMLAQSWKLLLFGSVNRDLLEHLAFGILEGGVENFIE